MRIAGDHIPGTQIACCKVSFLDNAEANATRGYIIPLTVNVKIRAISVPSLIGTRDASVALRIPMPRRVRLAGTRESIIS
jgi:hypothetical protein